LPEIQKIVMEFERESEMMDMKEEMMNDTIDDVMDEGNDEEESEQIVNQVLDEIGISLNQQVTCSKLTKSWSMLLQTMWQMKNPFQSLIQNYKQD
jgi:division protein CdvB (Snf7/Vps24/ESCRT-III family)